MTRWFLALLVVFPLACATPYDVIPPPAPTIEGTGVLVFTKIAGFRHPSIQAGAEALSGMAEDQGWTVVVTDNGAAFEDWYLEKFKAVVWLSTTWDVLSPQQEAAFQRYIEGGGGYVGIHAAADTEYDWPWYGELVGAWFSAHPMFPNVREADVIIEEPQHPATSMLPARWRFTDEWYSFKTNPRDVLGMQILASLDEATYGPGNNAAMGDHPIIWCHSVGQGRALYSGLGHTPAAFEDPLYLEHLAGSIRWAAGEADSPADSPLAPPGVGVAD